MGIELRGARVFVTGGAGFIGSYIVDQALAAGAERIVVVDDFVRGRHENLARAIMTGRVHVVEGDIRDAALVNGLMAGCDLVFHQAALRITQSAEEPIRAIEVMINGTQHVLEAAVRHGVKKVLAASSASVYGEASYLPMDEDHPFNNRTLYGAAKIANEQMLRSYAEMHGLRYVALRPFNVYGPRMDVFGAYTEVMIRWLERLSRGERPIIFGDGLQTMDFVYVEDVARAYLLAAASGATDVALNVGTGVETSLRQLCVLLCAAAGHPDLEPLYEAPRKVNPVARRQAGVEHARDAIGFVATTPLSEGLNALVRWHDDLLASASSQRESVRSHEPALIP
ncbi:MAG: NAD-dependent epimerase/dehydratase family protein [Chloroflexi bacterium]|nr:NAD-dependent epimerase/dehydratase family protein [Chloroflexota bacterium]